MAITWKKLAYYADITTHTSDSEAHKSERVVYIKVIADDADLAVADGLIYFSIPLILNGMNLVDADFAVITKSSSDLPTVMLEYSSDFGSGYADMLSTAMTIDENEYSSYTAAAQPVIDGAEDDVATGGWIRANCTTAGTGTKGFNLMMTFQLP